MTGILFLASIYFLAAVVVVPVAVRAGVGSVLGYIAAGIIIGPVLGLAGAEAEDVRHVGEFGVVLMLFLIGLELEPRMLWGMRQSLVGLGGLQIGLTAAAVAAAGLALGLAPPAALALGLTLALSSTAIALQMLAEKRLMPTAGGRAAFAVLLTQDLAVVPILAALPLLAGQAAAPGGADAGGGGAAAIVRLIDALPGWGVTLVTLGIVGGIVLAARFLGGPAFRFVHSARLAETSTFFSLLIVLAIAFLMTVVGLSPALGSFVAGVVLANSEFRHQIEADLAPFKGLLLGLFFMTVGAGIDLSVLAAAPATLLALAVGLMAVKAAILLVLGAAFGLAGRDRWLPALGLAQAGEFGFLLVGFAGQLGILAAADSQRVLMVIGLTMLMAPVAFMLLDRLGRRRPAGEETTPADAIEAGGRVIVAGIGRFGQVVNRIARMGGATTTVLDANLATIELMRRFGVKGYFGDPARPELLRAAGLDTASVLVVAVDDRAAAVRIVRFARSRRDDLHIVARARDRVHVYELFRAGADDIVRETFDASVRAGRYVLENIGLSEEEASRYARAYWRIDRRALKELAEVWQPGVAVHDNPAYMARARALDEELGAAALGELDDDAPDDAPRGAAG